MTLPPRGGVRKAVGVIPAHLLRDKRGDTSFPGDLRQGGRVAKDVRNPSFVVSTPNSSAKNRLPYTNWRTKVSPEVR